MSLEPWTRTGVKSGGEKVPARDDYEAFRQWWKVHSSVESAEVRSAPASFGADKSQGEDSRFQDVRSHVKPA